VIALIVVAVIVGAICWFGGAAIWNAVLVMHGRH
jgi:hypothetical protein